MGRLNMLFMMTLRYPLKVLTLPARRKALLKAIVENIIFIKSKPSGLLSFNHPPGFKSVKLLLKNLRFRQAQKYFTPDFPCKILEKLLNYSAGGSSPYTNYKGLKPR